MAELTVQPSARVANDLTLSNASGGGDKFANTGVEMLLVQNGSGGSINVTVATPQTVDGNAVADKVIAVADGKTALLGPFSKATYNDTDGFVNVTYSGTSSVKVAAIKRGAA